MNKRARADTWGVDEQCFRLAVGSTGRMHEIKEISRIVELHHSSVRKAVRRHAARELGVNIWPILAEIRRDFAKVRYPCNICCDKRCQAVGRPTYKCSRLEAWLSMEEPLHERAGRVSLDALFAHNL